jgi:hypothetical protein
VINGEFRTRLWRIWSEMPRVLWVMLNPSTAGEFVNDPTIETIIDFTQRWQRFGGIEVCNLYDFRATDPKALRDAGYPQSRQNESVLRLMMTAISEENGIVVVACGAHAQPTRLRNFVWDAAVLGVPLYHLGLNKGGSPKHPLYLKRDTKRELLELP